MTIKVPKRAELLFWIGLAGIVFYVLSPVFFPGIPTLRQPELLPVYTLMVGLGQLFKGNEQIKIETKPAEESNNVNEAKS